MSVVDNPLLGPTWEPIAQVLLRLVEDVRRGDMFSVQTYIRRFNLSPDTSPYLQAILDEDDRIQMELSGNLQVDPPLSENEYRELEFYGWTRPEVTADEYSAGGGEGNPNFVRYFESTDDVVDIVEFILTSLVGVFDMVESDFWGFGNGDTAERVAATRKLGRLKYSDGNPDRVIFALPGQHDDACGPDGVGSSAKDKINEMESGD